MVEEMRGQGLDGSGGRGQGMDRSGGKGTGEVWLKRGGDRDWMGGGREWMEVEGRGQGKNG